MRKINLNSRLLIVFVVFLTGLIIMMVFFSESRVIPVNAKMREAVQLTKKWFSIIKTEKEKRNIYSKVISNVKNNCLIGDDMTFTTTTLGSLTAKETATNPDFAALIVRLLDEAGIKKGDKIGLTLSGSFPSLAISTLAALQTVKTEVIVFSSLGASTFGANQENASWIDMENWLIKLGKLKYKSKLVTIGAENDSGLGMPEEGIEILQKTAARNNITLYMPENLNESVNKKTTILKNAKVKLLINIGGNQASLGQCSHSLTIPNGFSKKITTCNDKSRGIIMKMNENNIPIINLLNIKDLATKYGIAVSPGKYYPVSTNLYKKTKTNKIALSIIIVISLLSTLIIKKEL